MTQIQIVGIDLNEFKQLLKETVEGILHAPDTSNSHKTLQDGPDLIFAKDVCSLLQISRPTLYRLTSSGTIPHYKQGNKLYFLKADILEWIKRKKGVDQNRLEDIANQYILQNPIKK